MATTREQNDRLTQVGPGTPMGALLRRYWQPVAAAIELDEEPVRRVRFLGEDLTLYRSSDGVYGLVEDRCAHRCMSLEYGIPDPKGLRCAYHGWVYDASGACVEQPFEDRSFPEAHYRDRIKITAYPVQELGGLLFAYFGPQPAPLLPRWDLLVRDDIDVAVDVHVLPCNWLQCMDNAADPVHFEFLHAAFGNYTLKKLGKPAGMTQAKHLKIEFDVFRYGIMKRRLLEGAGEDSDDWRIGHPLIFPNLLAVGSEEAATLQYRIPIDDTRTLQIAYRTTKRKPGAAPLPITVKFSELFGADGKLVADTIPKQDMTGWIGQGPISDRTREHLTASDKGVILFHKLLYDNMDLIERGDDPMGIIRDRDENEPMVDIRREGKNLSAFEVRYDNYFEKIRSLADIRG
ncbi:MAG TPA: Rieske 2Fe-2S domain-containing protein [Candidatus Lustribacter sp.]|jgi:5,5'-dehydrodivanillate O-demethylase|nr:Rieske 2Fe-2S domain-containing protein [Candidatus Lustribacter sp.]